MTIISRDDATFHARCYDHYRHAKRHARTDLLPLVDTKLVQQIQTRIPPMNEADKATAPSSAAEDLMARTEALGLVVEADAFARISEELRRPAPPTPGLEALAKDFGTTPYSQEEWDVIIAAEKVARPRPGVPGDEAKRNAEHFGTAEAAMEDRLRNRSCDCGHPLVPGFQHDQPGCPMTARPAPAPLPATLHRPIQAADDPRHKQHGAFAERSKVARTLKGYIDHAVAKSPHRYEADQLQALDEICGKISRICCGDPNDPEHWDDVAGYAKLVADRLKGVVR